MRKLVKIALIVVPIIVVVIGVASFGGTLLYTKNNITHTVGEATITDYIVEVVIVLPPSIEYTAYIIASVPFELRNGGLYNIVDMSIKIKVYEQGFSLAYLNDLLLGEGENAIGTVLKGTT